MKIIIIEDEGLIAEQLEILIKQLEPEVEILAKLSSVKNASKWLSANPLPDLAFMDIQLSDGVSFELFDKFDITCPVIFTTAYNEYAIRAFKVNSIDYLVKPVDKNDLKSAIEKFKRLNSKTAESNISEELAGLIKNLSSIPKEKVYKQRFIVHRRNNLVPLEVSKVACIYREEIIYLLTFENEKLTCDHHSIEELEDLLDPKYFFRANRQFIIHIDSVESFRTDYSGKIFVKLKSPMNDTVDISRLKAAEFKLWVAME